jgi:hypothetical protein
MQKQNHGLIDKDSVLQEKKIWYLIEQYIQILSQPNPVLGNQCKQSEKGWKVSESTFMEDSYNRKPRFRWRTTWWEAQEKKAARTDMPEHRPIRSGQTFGWRHLLERASMISSDRKIINKKRQEQNSCT